MAKKREKEIPSCSDWNWKPISYKHANKHHIVQKKRYKQKMSFSFGNVGKKKKDDKFQFWLNLAD